MEDNSGFRNGYIDMETGEILMTFEGCEEEEELEIIDKIDSNPDRYLTIEPIESHEGFRIMEKFVDALPEGENQKLLTKVLSWKKPFSNFKNALSDMGDLRQDWFDFHDKELRRIAVEWLELHGLEAELVSYGETGLNYI